MLGFEGFGAGGEVEKRGEGLEEALREGVGGSGIGAGVVFDVVVVVVVAEGG